MECSAYPLLCARTTMVRPNHRTSSSSAFHSPAIAVGFHRFRPSAVGHRERRHPLLRARRPAALPRVRWTISTGLRPKPPHPINWNLLSGDDAEAEWIELNRWVNWLRRTYGLPASVVPPFWHRHPELVWELSALHLHWLGAYDPDQHGSAPFGWHRDFADGTWDGSLGTDRGSHVELFAVGLGRSLRCG